MIQRRSWKLWLLALAVLHGIVALAGFFAPYDPTEQDRERPYLPPMKIHLVDAQGHFHLRPFFYPVHLRGGSFDQFEESTDQAVPLLFFVSGVRYRFLGLCRLAYTSLVHRQAESICWVAMRTAATNSREFSMVDKSLCSLACWGRDSLCSSARSSARRRVTTAAGETDY